ncbi:MAG: hypothetical protein EPO21_02395 [Chloroflexota bacterium]|nr:MAG: hypothetical protein EPO21_02395 [Chloroflexota bacterium]
MGDKASPRLIEDVVHAGLCTLCGACVKLCPYLRVNPRAGEIRRIDECNLALEDGRCYAFCPRTSLDLTALSHAVFGVPYASGDVGEARKVALMRSLDPQIAARAQYGGVTTTLLIVALELHLVDALVLTKSEQLMPEPTIATTREEVLACAGTNFIMCPVLEAYNVAARGSATRIGVVGVPCQMQALAKRRTVGFEGSNNVGKLALTIGLFCTWAFERTFFDFVAKRVDPSRIRKTDIPPHPADAFLIYTDDTVISIPLAEVREHIQPACNSCIDMTAEFADVSVGAPRGIEGWNTVIVRSEVGEELIAGAEHLGLLEVRPLPEERVSNLKRAAKRKKQRAVKHLGAQVDSNDNLGYLKMPSGVLENLDRD